MDIIPHYITSKCGLNGDKPYFLYCEQKIIDRKLLQF